MFSDARFQSKTNEKLLCLLEHLSIDVFKLRLGLYSLNRRIHQAPVCDMCQIARFWRHSKLATFDVFWCSISIKNKWKATLSFGASQHWCFQASIRFVWLESTKSTSRTQKKLKIHGQKGHLQRSPAIEKKIPSNLSELPENFKSIQTHSKATFLKDWRRSEQSCMHQHRWPDTQKSSKNGQFWRPRAVSYGTSIFEKRACIFNMDSLLLSRSNFLAKKHKLWRMLDRDMKFSPSTSARARKKSPASFCVA